MRLAVVFPGQGIQRVGMFNDGLEDPITADYIYQAQEYLNEPWCEWLVHGPQSVLDQTEYTQPIVLVTSYALYQSYLDKGGVEPVVFAGHSLGEWTALLAAQTFSFQDALFLVKQRALAMQKSTRSEESGMVVVMGLEDSIIFDLCAKVSSYCNRVVEPVNFNSPNQIVVAGHLDALASFSSLAKDSGAKRVMQLPVSGAFHSSLMISAMDDLSKALEKVNFSQPSKPVVHNVSARTYNTISDIKNILVRQVCEPVQWVNTIKYFEQMGITHVLECSPRKVLSGLIRQIAPQLQVVCFQSPKDELPLDLL